MKRRLFITATCVAFADKNGIVQEKLSYDAWGKRRNINGTAISLSVLNAFKPKFSQKGFTNHKHVDSVGLIHMNGRVYDPITARFLSADPIIQSPSNLQSLNRYSYVMNNPLSFVDPSGYFSWRQELDNVKGAGLVALGIGVALVGGAAVTVALGPIFGPVAGSIVVSMGFAIAQMGENLINDRPATENVIIEASVTINVDHGSFDNSKPVKVTQPVHTAETNTTASQGTIGSPGVTGMGSGVDPDLIRYGIACAHADLRACGVNVEAHSQYIGQETSNLGIVGNSIRGQLTSGHEKELFDHYWQGNGGMVLEVSKFMGAANAAQSLTVTSEAVVAVGEGRYTAKVISFYGNPDLDQAYGRATLFYDGNSNAVGLRDTYDFDSKRWGIRPIQSEIQTRAVNFSGEIFGNAKPYIICFGVGCY